MIYANLPWTRDIVFIMESGINMLQTAFYLPCRHVRMYIWVNLLSSECLKSVMISEHRRWDVKSMHLTQLGTNMTKIKLSVLTSIKTLHLHSRGAVGCVRLCGSAQIHKLHCRNCALFQLWGKERCHDLSSWLQILLPFKQQTYIMKYYDLSKSFSSSETETEALNK